MTKIELVIFDMAGTTLIDRHEVENCFAQTCSQEKLPVSKERILSLQGYSKLEVFQLLWAERLGEDHPEYQENVAHSYDLFKMILEDYYINADIAPTFQCLPTFDWLRQQGIKIALTTGFYRAVANIILKKQGWLQGLDDNYMNTSGLSPIDLSVTSDEVKYGRPKPDMIQLVLEKLNLSNLEAVVNIGDTPSDLLSGISAGVGYNLAVANGTHTREQLLPFPHYKILDHLGHLPSFIQKVASKPTLLTTA